MRTLRIWGLITVILVFSSLICGAPTARRTDRQNKRTKKMKKTQRPRPWQLNQYVCPPLLCPPISSALTTIGSDVQAEPPRTFDFFEGDIVLDSTQLRDMVTLDGLAPPSSSSTRGRSRRSVVRPIDRLWKYGVVPYTIDQSLGPAAQRAIHYAMKHYEENTCIKFVSKTRDHKDYLSFVFQPGCWSSVGKTKGEQYLSVGPGCENLGTVVHEMGHALGFWHEQSRLDRNKYVKIVKKNIASRYLKQFGIRAKNESTTRGYPYDYQSIMHYGPDYFTANGKDTIQIIGIGRKLHFKVGQRDALSDLDIAQLNEMYYCNTKDRIKAVCPLGWTANGNSCYKFVTSNKQFSAASRYCQQEGSHLVHINSDVEDKFIKKHLITHYSKYPKWRTGGKKAGDKFIWVGEDRKSYKKMKFTSWSPKHPGKFSSLVLVRFDGTPPRYVWKGDWVGSASQLPRYAYPFICETPQDGSCIKSQDGKGRDYRGKLSYTAEGLTCQNWASQYPHRHTLLTGDLTRDAKNGMGNHNYCRNPRGLRDRPWCYTTKSKTKWQYCELNVC